MEPISLSPAAFARLVIDETQRAAQIMNAPGLKRT
jgi:hypothetical protein